MDTPTISTHLCITTSNSNDNCSSNNSKNDVSNSNNKGGNELRVTALVTLTRTRILPHDDLVPRRYLHRPPQSHLQLQCGPNLEEIWI